VGRTLGHKGLDRGAQFNQPPFAAQSFPAFSANARQIAKELPLLLVGGLGGTLITHRVLDYVGRSDDDRKLRSLYLLFDGPDGPKAAAFRRRRFATRRNLNGTAFRNRSSVCPLKESRGNERRKTS
jgi:hypothetical protein